ncbi:hypothetical protein B0H12DRAFT_1228795 [Mycena haematopus]|nr:hypothetical protein B0H12DRAFT_1228795 [Mycena haematopus]
MSLTLLWDGVTHYFESRPEVAGHGQRHYNARWECRLHEHIHVINTDIESQTIILKIARDAGEIAALELEAQMYSTRLTSIQGNFVPYFYGIYHGAVGGSPVACMLLEDCVAGDKELSFSEKNRKVMLAACALHSVGVRHCDLENRHHFVFSGSNIKIVDFSRAVPHKCYGATPRLHPGMGGPDSDGCYELEMLEKLYGVFRVFLAGVGASVWDAVDL